MKKYRGVGTNPKPKGKAPGCPGSSIKKSMRFHISWLKCAVQNHEKLSGSSVVKGDMTIGEYIEKYCKEDLDKIVEVK